MFNKNCFAVLFMAALLFCSCSKKSSDMPEVQSDDVDIALINEVENLPNSLVSLGYNKFTSKEKVVFWTRHVDRYLKLHSNLDERTVNHIKKLRTFLSVDLYDKSQSADMKKYVNEFEKAWLLDAIEKQGFDAKTLVEVGTLRGAGKAESTLEIASKLSFTTTTENCTCYYTAYCLPASCISQPECAAGQPDNPGDCGVFGTSRCTGRCG